MLWACDDEIGFPWFSIVSSGIARRPVAASSLSQAISLSHTMRLALSLFLVILPAALAGNPLVPGVGMADPHVRETLSTPPFTHMASMHALRGKPLSARGTAPSPLAPLTHTLYAPLSPHRAQLRVVRTTSADGTHNVTTFLLFATHDFNKNNTNFNMVRVRCSLSQRTVYSRCTASPLERVWVCMHF